MYLPVGDELFSLGHGYTCYRIHACPRSLAFRSLYPFFIERSLSDWITFYRCDLERNVFKGSSIINCIYLWNVVFIFRYYFVILSYRVSYTGKFNFSRYYPQKSLCYFNEPSILDGFHPRALVLSFFFKSVDSPRSSTSIVTYFSNLNKIATWTMSYQFII